MQKRGSLRTVHFVTDSTWANSRPNRVNHRVLRSAAGRGKRIAPCSWPDMSADTEKCSLTRRTVCDSLCPEVANWPFIDGRSLTHSKLGKFLRRVVVMK